MPRLLSASTAQAALKHDLPLANLPDTLYTLELEREQWLDDLESAYHCGEEATAIRPQPLALVLEGPGHRGSVLCVLWVPIVDVLRPPILDPWVGRRHLHPEVVDAGAQVLEGLRRG